MKTIPYYVVIEGNIGSGKTTVSELLAQHLGAELILEKFIDNPFLPKFYQDPERFAFSVETGFLAERFHQFNQEFSKINVRKQRVVADYSFYKSLIFARKTLNSDEFLLFRDLFQIMNQKLPQPGLLVYLHAPTEKLLAQIKSRGRNFEQQIEAAYLEKISESYQNFMQQASGLRCVVFHTELLDFIKYPAHFEWFVNILSGEFKYGITEIFPPENIIKKK